jgi:hypothetical protein
MSPDNAPPTGELPLLPEQYEHGLGLPFGGLFGNGVTARVLGEMVADPFRSYGVGELAELTEATSPSLRAALAQLIDLGIVTKTPVRAKSWVYGPMPGSKRVLALTLLSLAILDDRANTTAFDDAVRQLVPHDGPTMLVAQVAVMDRPSNFTIYASGTGEPVPDISQSTAASQGPSLMVPPPYGAHHD